MRSDPLFCRELNQALDYDVILRQISSFASFSASREAIEKAMPKGDLLAVRKDLSLAKEAMEYEQSGRMLSAGGLSDISRDVQMAQKGSVLTPGQLLQIASFLAACRTVSRAFEAEASPGLHEIAAAMDICPHLFEAIGQMIDLSGSVKEDATPALKALYAQQSRLKQALGSAGRNFVKKHSSDLMESMTTTIGGRLCVLLKAASKNKYGGMIHGSSQSGQAFYVEVQEFVDLNNDLQAIASQIEEEKLRICRQLSLQVKAKALALESDLESVLLIDVAFTKARWALANDGVIPILQTRDHEMVFEHARHPLIDKSKAVYNTYKLSKNQNCLMISGPNMGGKTVTLKTIGVFVVLAHAGFPVLAHRALVPWYEQIWLDIGDNQSIENNLSTFSSHVLKLSQITSAANDKTFVLLDEAGNGTDPLEGSALAQAVLENLIDANATIITSTHYNDVKAYGKTDSRILVSSVEFDPQTLKPTYRYLPGLSGASYAFTIAAQFQLDSSIIERAQNLKKINESQVQKQMEQLEKQQQIALAKQDRFDQLIAKAHGIQREAQKEKEKWEKQKKQLDEEYESRLEAMLEAKEQQANAILKELRSRKPKAMHEDIALASSLKALDDTAKKKPEPARRLQADFQAGDYVRIEALNNHGEILSVKKNKAQVLVNGKKIQVSTDQLIPMKRPQVQSSVSSRKERSFEAFPLELNVIGMRVEEGLAALDRYLDQAVFHRIKNVRIVHGMGTGAMRKAVWQDLASRSTVKKYSAAGPDQGGLGATLVELK